MVSGVHADRCGVGVVFAAAVETLTLAQPWGAHAPPPDQGDEGRKSAAGSPLVDADRDRIARDGATLTTPPSTPW